MTLQVTTKQVSMKPVRKPAKPRAKSRARGVAMLLVLVMLAGVTILTSAALSTNDASPQIGSNAVSEVKAAWAAESAAQIVAAVLETSYDYTASGGTVMNSQTMMGGTATVRVTTPAGDPPSADDRELLMTATATVNGVSKTIKKLVSITPAIDPTLAVDPHLGEFAVFTTGSLQIDAGATVTMLPSSPDATVAKAIPLGTGFSSSGSLSIDPGAIVNGATLWTDVTANTALKDLTTATDLATGGRPLPMKVPAAPDLLPSVFSSLPVGRSSDYVVDGTQTVLAAAGSYTKLSICNGGKVGIDQATGANWSFDELRIETNSTLVVSGKVSIHVKGVFDVRTGGCIALADSASSVTFYTANDISIADCGVGVDPSIAQDTSRNPDKIATYIPPTAVTICALPTSSGGIASPTISLNDKAVVVANIHSPTAAIIIDNGSALLGRATCTDMRIAGGCTLYYDPRLDNRVGFTTVTGPLYNADGTPVTGLVTALSSFDTSTGAGALKTYLTTNVSALTVGTIVDLGLEDVPVVLDGGGAGSTPSERTTRRAQVRPCTLDSSI